MSLSEEELTGQMKEEVEAILGQLMGEKKPADEITLTEIEQLVLVAGQRFQQALTERLVKASEQADEAPSACRDCGGKLRHKGYRRKRMVTETGEVTVKRAYYYCETCQKGIFPPG